MAKYKIEPNVIISITTHNIVNIPIIVTDFTGNIRTMTHIDKIGYNDYHIRKAIISIIDGLIPKYGVDTILIEQNQLFIDKIEKYPDPYVLRNIKLGFGIQTTLEDKYWDKIKYILEIPRWEWKKEVLNRKVDYAIDLYKSHILQRQNLSDEQIKEIDENNYYETLCLSESMLCSKFLKKSYQVNK